MHALVFAGRHDAQVFGVVVLFVAIDMVHDAALEDFAADLLFGDAPMFVLPFTVVIEVLHVAVVDAPPGAEKDKIYDARKGEHGKDEGVD